VGSCNTVYPGDRGFHGANTDVSGFTASLADFLDGTNRISGMKATVIGAGGTARAVVYALSRLGAEICVINRTPERAGSLAADFGCTWAPLGEESVCTIKRYSDLIVQTTSAGMYPQENVDPLRFYEFSGDELVYDVIYTPAETAFLRRAKDAGCKTQNGERMLLAQAYCQFKIFTGLDYPAECRGRRVF
jgi:3-dehydroquinate dehydratase / shikimate dehydrogenase